MNIFERLLSRISSKASQARIVNSINQIGQPQNTPANYTNFANKGYSKNVVVFTAISKIATACGGINWVLYKGKGKRRTEITESPYLDLLDKPNPLQARASFIEAVIAFRLISGNSYIEANTGVTVKSVGKVVPLELWPMRPDRMKIVPGKLGYPAAYLYTNGEYRKEFLVDPVSLQSNVMQWKTFNPLNDWYGLSPLEAAMLALDQNNAGQSWNLAMLQNSATPSGVLQMKITDANPRGALTDDQYRRLKVDIKEKWMGSKNAGMPQLLEGGLEWKQMSLTPKDMDFINSREVTAADLALAFGVPGELMGVGEKTFNNYKEARLAFYEETVLPTMDSLRDSFNLWLLDSPNSGYYLDYDTDNIEALVYRREQKFTSLSAVNFLDQNEKREAVGYEPREGWDVFVIGNQVLKTPDDADTGTDDGTGEGDNANNESTEEVSDTEETDSEVEDDQSTNETESEDGKGWKSINLLTPKEKRQSWKRQNEHRARLTKSFDRDLRVDFAELIAKLTSRAAKLEDSRDAKFIEMVLIKECDDFMPVFAKTISKHIRYTLEDFGGAVLGEGKSAFGIETKANLRFDSYVRAYIERHTGKQVKSITNTNEKTIRRIISEWTATAIQDGDSLPELSKFIQSEFEELTPARANTIARTEVGMASNNGAREAVKSLQIPGMTKEWVSAQDDRVRDGDHGGADHAAANGQVVPIDEKFLVPPDASMDGPGDTSADADQVINCRCVCVFKRKSTGGE